MRRNTYFGVALFGLLVVAAISVAAGSGRKPPKEVQSAVSVRPISGSEVMAILNKFPEMVPNELASERSDTNALVSQFGFSEVTAAPLEHAFPAARFYQGLDFMTADAQSPYLMAVAGDKRYAMPEEFNRLLLDGGLRVTDRNTAEMAEAFVISAVGNRYRSFPEITYMGVSASKLRLGGIPFSAMLKVKIGEQVEEWYFDTWRSQLRSVLRRSTEGLTIDFYAPAMVESLPSRGQLDLTPDIAIETTPNGNAYVEYDTMHPPNPHYYVDVEVNSDTTNDSVVFSLSGFPPESTNIYVAVYDFVRIAFRYFSKVEMDSGHGTVTWRPPVAPTGFYHVTAGYASAPNDTGSYVPFTGLRELTPERLKTATFAGGTDSLRVYFVDQFFPQNDTHASTFAQYVKEAMLESWRTQVDTWNLGTPPDADHMHQASVFGNYAC